MGKRFIAIFSFALSVGMSASAQLIYYGYPVDNQLKIGDRVIINLPKHLHNRFYETPESTALYNFLTVNQRFKFEISIHVFVDSPEYDVGISEHLKKSLENMLKLNCKLCSYAVTAKGRTAPVFLNEASPSYRQMNTRLEILVE